MKAPRAAPGVKVVVPLSAVNDFLNSFAQQPASNIDNTAMSPVTSKKRKALGPAETSDSANKRAKITALSQPECNVTRQSTDEETAAVTQTSGPDIVIPSIEEPAIPIAGPAKPFNRLRLQRVQRPNHGRASDSQGNVVLCPKEDDTAIIDRPGLEHFYNPLEQPTSMIGKLNKHKRDMAAKRAKAAHDATIAAQQQHILAEDTSQHKDTIDATSTNKEELTGPGMEEAANRQTDPRFAATGQAQTQTLPSDEPSNAHHIEPSVRRSRWILGSIVDSVSRYVPAFTRAPLRTIQENYPGSNMPQTEVTHADGTLPSAVGATNSSKVKKPSHKSVDQRKASSKRKKAQISAEKKQAQLMEARKREINNEVARRVHEAMKAQYEADKASHPGEKRKRYSPESIPNPAGVSYGFDPAFFGYDSDSDEEPAPASPCLRPAKRVRLILETTKHVFPSDEINGNPFAARPYTGTIFADPPPRKTPALSKRPRKIFANPPHQISASSDPSGINHSGTFKVPDASDSDDDDEESEAPAPALSSIAKGKAKATDDLPYGWDKSTTTNLSARERQAIIDAEYARVYDGLATSKLALGQRWGPKELRDRAEIKLDWFIANILPPLPEKPVTLLPLEDKALVESLAKARQKATQYSPKRPSALRFVDRISTSPTETPSDDGNTAEAYEPNGNVAAKPTENITKKFTSSTDGKANKALRGILKPSGGNASGAVSENMVPTKVNETQISAKESQVNHGNQSQFDNAKDNQVGNANDNQVNHGNDNQVCIANEKQVSHGIQSHFNNANNNQFDNANGNQVHHGNDNQVGIANENQVHQGNDNQVGIANENQVNHGIQSQFDNANGNQVHHGNDSQVGIANDNQVNYGNQSQFDNANDNQFRDANDSECMPMDLEPPYEPPPVESSFPKMITGAELANFQFHAFGAGTVQWDTLVLQQLAKNWTQADADRAVRVGAKQLAQHLAMQHSRATN